MEGYSKRYKRVFFVAGVLALLLPLPFHHRHDYGAFVTQWRAMLTGVNPWLYPNGVMTGNSYGPLFNLFQYLYQIHSHLPHLLFIFLWLALSGFILKKYGDSPAPSEKEKKFWFWFLILNPFFWITIVS
jgi:hypothetical protein